MPLKADLESEVSSIFRSQWEERDGTVVPGDNSLKLGNDAIKLEATVLYADLADSTQLVDSHGASFAAEIYKAFLLSAAKIIRSENGTVTAYDGDRVMAVFIGERKNTSAVKTAMKIHWAAFNIIGPAMKRTYATTAYSLRHVVGIDTSNVFVAKTGARGANDLVWVGRAANYAAKLAALPHSYPSYITKEVYDMANAEVKTASDGRAMWEAVRWDNFDNRIIYRSNWWWSID